MMFINYKMYVQQNAYCWEVSLLHFFSLHFHAVDSTNLKMNKTLTSWCEVENTKSEYLLLKELNIQKRLFGKNFRLL